jgi:phage/conjugal plasmid C-4 type zinc finger TraR family protein
MAGGWSRDGAVRDQIDASVDDAVSQARRSMPSRESALLCDECGVAIPEKRRAALSGVRFCLVCQEQLDQAEAVYTQFNRRGSKDSQLR